MGRSTGSNRVLSGYRLWPTSTSANWGTMFVLLIVSMSHALAGMGPLEKFLDLGFSDGWGAGYESGVYWLENSREQGAIRYYYTAFEGTEGGSRTISVRVKMLTDDQNARVGLVYGYNSQTRHYSLILLGPEGQLEVVRRDASGFNTRMSSSTGVNIGKFTQLSLQEDGNRISVLVDGRDIGSLANDSFGRGSVGIAAVGLGRFGFSDYQELSGKRLSMPSGEAVVSPVAKISSSGAQRKGSKNITWFPIVHTQTGELMSEVPLPADWTVTPQQWSAPDNIRAKAVAGEFLNGVDTNVDQIIQSKLVPFVTQSGNRVLRIEDYPEIAEYDRNYSAMLWKFAPTEDQHSAKGIVYQDDKNLMGVLVVQFKRSRSQFGTSAFYSMHLLEGPAAVFNQRKQEFLNALANQRPNPEQIAAYNQREQQKASIRTQNFNIRQRQKQQQFDNWMSTQRQNSESALDSSMESWRRRQGMIDSGQQKQVDAIHGTTPVYNPNTGQTWQVEDGYNRYYMNNSGEYLPTDDQFYNPNRDPSLNNQEWTEVTPNYYGQ